MASSSGSGSNFQPGSSTMDGIDGLENLVKKAGIMKKNRSTAAQFFNKDDDEQRLHEIASSTQDIVRPSFCRSILNLNLTHFGKIVCL